jgi:hypothetical protein
MNMRTGIIFAFALMLAAVAAPSAQASPLMPAGSLAGIERNDGIEFARYKVWHRKKVRHVRHHHVRQYAWVRHGHRHRGVSIRAY